MANSKPVMQRTLIDVVRDGEVKARKLAGESRSNFAGVAYSSALAGGTGKRGSDDNVQNQDAYLRTAGDTMIGAIAYYPTAVTINSGAIDISQDTTNAYSSYVYVTGEGATDDTIATITGAQHAGQVIYIQPTALTALTFTETGGNIQIPGGADFTVNSAHDGASLVKLIFDISVAGGGNEWVVVSSSETASGGSGDNLGNHIATQILDMAGFSISNYIGYTAAVGQSSVVDTNGITWGLNTTEEYLFNINGAAQLTIKETAIDVESNGLSNFIGYTGLVGQALTVDGTGNTYDLPTGDQYNMRINGSSILALAATGAALDGDLTMQDHYIQMTEMSAPGTPGSTLGRLYLLAKGGTNSIYFKDDAGTEFDLTTGAGSVFPVSDSLFEVTGSVDATRTLKFEVDGISASTTRTITWQDASGVPALLNSGATQVFSDHIDMNGNDILDVGEYQFDISSQRIVGSTNGVDFYIPASDEWRWFSDGSEILTIREVTQNQLVELHGQAANDFTKFTCTNSAGTKVTAFEWDDLNGYGKISASDELRLSSTIITVIGGRPIKSASSTEIAFQVTNDSLTIGSEGTVQIPTANSSTTSKTTLDGLYGNVHGSIGVHDTGSGNLTLWFRQSDANWAAATLTRDQGT